MRLGFCSPVALVAELRRRKVWRVAVVYVVVAAGVIGFADAALPGPLWHTIQVPVLAIVLLGFPIALALAWSYDLTWGGIERTRASPAAGIIEEKTPGEPDTSPTHVSAETSHGPIVSDANSQRSIVVLPFDNLSPDDADAYLADGLAEEITADLAGIRALRVISRTSAFQYRKTKKDTRTIAGELCVRYVLEGSVRKAGEDLRITAQLIDAASDSHLWARKYVGTMSEIFALQERVSRSIVETLAVRLDAVEDRRLAEHAIPDLRAFELYLLARQELYRFTSEGLQSAHRRLERALEITGDNAALLGSSRTFTTSTGISACASTNKISDWRAPTRSVRQRWILRPRITS